MQRRSFLGSILAACAAPAYVKAGNLMPLYIPAAPRIWAPQRNLIPMGHGELRLYDAAGAVLASIGLGGMDGGLFQGDGIALRAGLAKTCRFDIPGIGPWVTTVGVSGSDAGFQMNTVNLCTGGPLLVSGQLQRM